MQKQVKTYPKKEKEIEDRYYDFGCPYYGKLFAVPSCWIRRVTINGDNNYVKAKCPYCWDAYHVLHLDLNGIVPDWDGAWTSDEGGI